MTTDFNSPMLNECIPCNISYTENTCPKCSASEAEHERVLRLAKAVGFITNRMGGIHTRMKREYITTEIATLIELTRAEALEEAAVIAWNHYMDTCKKKGISPVTFQDYCAASAIRAIKDK